MKQRLLTTVAVFGLVSSLATIGHAADLVEPAYIPPAPPPVEIVSTSGWYLRGDVGYVFSHESDGYYSYVQQDSFTGHDFLQGQNYDSFKSDSAFYAGGGLGYRLNDFARFDVTADYFSSDLRGTTNCVGFASTTCKYDDSSSVDIWTAMANAYVDFYHSGRFSTYVGAGAGGAYVSYGDLKNKYSCDPAAASFSDGLCDSTFTHEGYAKWRFAASLMAGATFDITDHLKLDAGYKYTRISSGDAFGFDEIDKSYGYSGVQGRDHGFDIHTIRAGLRYEFGGADGYGFGKGKAPVYAEAPLYNEPAPDYGPTPVYK